MRVLKFSFFSCFFLLVSACTSTSNVTPLTHTATAMKQKTTFRIFWLDERLNTPEKLVELTVMQNGMKYKTEYLWVNGVVREIHREGDVFIEGKAQQQSLIIRYDLKGQGVYQSNRISDNLLPLRNKDLIFYYQGAENTLQTAKKLIKQKEYFFQGHVKENEFKNCINETTEKLILNDIALEEHIQNKYLNEYFIAAVGSVRGNANRVENLIYLGAHRDACFDASSFEK